jgi:hypothetical protein
MVLYQISQKNYTRPERNDFEATYLRKKEIDFGFTQVFKQQTNHYLRRNWIR